MRKGFNGLALQVQELLRRDPHSGHLFVFRGRRGGLIKILWHDGQRLPRGAKGAPWDGEACPLPTGNFAAAATEC